MNIIDATKDILGVYEKDRFSLDKWKSYMESNVPKAKEKCLHDMEDSLHSGLSWDKDYLPVLNLVPHNIDKLAEITGSFYKVTDNLSEIISAKFGRSLDADIILYLGLCNGAGWVTEIDNRTTVLLGIEKIIELDWSSVDAMNGLILHELGHVYQAQFGVLHRETDSSRDGFLWQLFTEGIAMVFEQEIVGDPDYFHEDIGGWKEWCSRNLSLIKQSFYNDLDTMTRENQRYFGDWVRFNGYSDVGYYLGARFVRFLLESDSFDNLISYDIDDVRNGFEAFL